MAGDDQTSHRALSRRSLLRAGTAAGAGLLFGGAATRVAATGTSNGLRPYELAGASDGHRSHDGGLLGVEGEVDHRRNRFNPTDMLDDWDFGQVSRAPDGQTLREYRMVALDQTIEVAPGVFFESWNYNGRVPGPTLRCTEGDRIRIEFVNAGTHPHTIHFHGIHAASMDGVPGVGAGVIEPGASTVYEFDAAPFGCHLYHCHSLPLTRHIHKGLYGAFIVDPDPSRFSGAEAQAASRRTFEGARDAGVKEMVMVMNGFDTNFDGENEIYAINSIAFHYMKHPIRIGTDDDVRLYLINVTEFDPVNSLHLHANFFDYYDHGTTLTPTLKTIDTVMQVQAQRGILEFNFNGFEPGSYMFHAHQSEFAELGWMSFFEVVEGRTV
ncbi:MAG: multicopper oxidase domain-containing protein [Actinomycetota bacterium]